MAGNDERDTIFSRMELSPGDSRYGEYYGAHPERKASDDSARAARGPWPGDEELRRLVDSTFSLLESMRPLARGPSDAVSRLELGPEQARDSLDRLARSYGAALFGVAEMGESCFYHTRGRGAEYGQPASRPGNTGIVFAVRMDPAELAFAPAPRASAEVVNAYARVALIGLVVARCLRGWGYEAACTMDGRADLILPIAARYAGLGSIGRSSLLVTEEYGPCVRLGAVLTDMPIARTPRTVSKAGRACAACTRCADACPAGALPFGDPSSGGFGPVDDDACFAQWRKLGTDCGLCIASCPLSRCPR